MFNHVWWFFFSLFVFYSLWQPSQPQIKSPQIQNSVRQCHQRTLRPAKGDPTDSGRDQSGARVVSYGQYQGIGRLWFVINGVAVALYPSSKTFDPSISSSTFFSIFFFSFLYVNKISNSLSFSLFFLTWCKKLEEIEGRIESWSFLLIHAARCTRWRSCNYDRYAYFSLGILRRRGNFRLA